MTQTNRDDRIRALLRTQDGVLAVRQVREAGYSRAQIAARVKKGEWTRDLHGVLRAADHPVTPRSRIRAATLSFGDEATLVGRSAAFWWRLTDVAPAEVEVAVEHQSQPRPREGVRLIRRGVPETDRVVVDGVAVTKKPATVLAAAASLGLLLGARLMDQALQAGVNLEAMRSVHRRTAGRYGALIAFELLVLAGGGARSEAERSAHRRLREAGLDSWHADHEVWLPGFGRAVLDVAFVDRKVLVEIDGWAYHRGLRAFLRDARRQNALVLDGWVVIRTNWFELREDPQRFVGNVVEALAGQSRSGSL